MNPTDVFSGNSTPPAGALRLTYVHQGLGFIDPDGVTRKIETVDAVTLTTPLTGATINSLAKVNETNYVTPAGTIAALTWTLPSGENSVVGQVKTLQSSQIITALTVSGLASGVISGTALTAAAAGVTYQFQCVSIVAGVATWLRIR